MAAKERTTRSKSPQSFDTDLRQTEVTTYSNRAQAREGNTVKAVGTAVRKPVIAADKSDKYTSFAPQKYVTDYSDLVKFGGEMAIDAYKGYKEAEAETEIEGTLKDYFDGQIADAAIPGAAADKVNAELRMNDNYGDDRDPGEYSESDEQTLKEATDNLHQLARLKQRGAKNSTELNVKVEALVRKYINQVPGLATEFRNIAKNTLGDSSATLNRLISQEKSEAEIAKEQRKIYNANLQAARVAGFDGPPQEALYRLNLERQQIQRSVALDRAVTNDRLLAERLTQQPEWSTKVSATFATARTTIQAINDNPELDDRTKSIRIIGALQEQIAAIGSTYGYTEAGKSLVTSMEAMAKIYEGFRDGSIPAEKVKNSVAWLENSNRLRLLSDPAIAGQLAFMAAGGAGIALEIASQEVRDHVSTLNWNVQTVAYGLYAGQTNRPPGVSKKEYGQGSALFLGAMSKHISQNVNSDDPAVIEGNKWVMSKLSKAVDSWKASDGAEVMDAFIKNTANADIIPFLEKYDPDGEFAKKALLISGEFIAVNIKDRIDQKFDSNTMKITYAQDGTARVEALGTQPSDVIKVIKNLQENYIPRINNYIRTFQHMNGGVDYGKTARTFYSQLLGQGSMPEDPPKGLPTENDTRTPQEIAMDEVINTGQLPLAASPSEEGTAELVEQHNRAVKALTTPVYNYLESLGWEANLITTDLGNIMKDIGGAIGTKGFDKQQVIEEAVKKAKKRLEKSIKQFDKDGTNAIKEIDDAAAASMVEDWQRIRALYTRKDGNFK